MQQVLTKDGEKPKEISDCLAKAYIGTVTRGSLPGRPLLFNKGYIFRLQENGKYFSKEKMLTLDKDEVLHDVSLGYLAPYAE